MARRKMEPGEEPRRIIISISFTETQAKQIEQLAAEKNITKSSLIHSWVITHL